LESELFGHERGAFTGATASRPGRFEQANGGTLFLDEIGDLPSSLQPKLLTVLQDREYFRVGGSKLLQTDARVIAATNVHLPGQVALGHFREDLYYRLNIIELHIPPLRERKEDIPALALECLKRIASKRGREEWVLAPEAVEALVEFSWPGNIRQLQNVLERASAFADGKRLVRNDILPLIRESSGDGSQPGKVPTLHEAERKAFIAAYLASGRNKARTARQLGVSERTVYNMLARHGLR
jgi:transcriptional regulator with PAS, ATPase and Fis domain